MLHPSYTDLMNAVNSGAENSEEPTINSRYSIVIAASRRARQLIDESEKVGSKNCFKPLSVAVDELYNGQVKIVSEDDFAEEDIDLNRDIFADMDDDMDAEDFVGDIEADDVMDAADNMEAAEEDEDME